MTHKNTYTQYDWTLKTLHKPAIKGSDTDLRVCKVDMGPAISLFLSCLSSRSESLYALTLSLSLAFSQMLSSLLVGIPEHAWVTCSRAEPPTMLHTHTACPITSCPLEGECVFVHSLQWTGRNRPLCPGCLPRCHFLWFGHGVRILQESTCWNVIPV